MISFQSFLAFFVLSASSGPVGDRIKTKEELEIRLSWKKLMLSLIGNDRDLKNVEEWILKWLGRT